MQSRDKSSSYADTTWALASEGFWSKRKQMSFSGILVRPDLKTMSMRF